MTLNQAIARYTNNAEYERRNGCLQGCMEFRQLAEWLKELKEYKEQEPCDDAISREDAEQMFRNIRSHLKPQDYKSAEEFNTRDLMLLNAEQMIHALPSITQKSETVTEFADRCRECGAKYGKMLEQKSGKWIYRAEDKYSCSKCGTTTRVDEAGIDEKPMYKFCPNCGTKMIEPQESEE